MAYLQEQMKLLKYDKRLLEINQKNGSLTDSDYNSYLGQLKDLTSQSEKLVLDDSNSESRDKMDSYGAKEQAMPQTPPPSSDPFGSGF